MNDQSMTFFNLKCAPFSKEIPDNDLWIPPSKEELIAEIRDAIMAHESATLTGDPGVGKTCVLRALRNSISRREYKLTYCPNVTLGRRDFYRQLCVALGLAPHATAGSVFYAVSAYVNETGKERLHHPVFLLDEAHLLTHRRFCLSSSLACPSSMSAWRCVAIARFFRGFIVAFILDPSPATTLAPIFACACCALAATVRYSHLTLSP